MCRTVPSQPSWYDANLVQNTAYGQELEPWSDRSSTIKKRGRDLPSGKIWRYQTAFCCRPQSTHAQHQSHDGWAFWQPPPAASEDAEDTLFIATLGNVKMLTLSCPNRSMPAHLREMFAFYIISVVWRKRCQNALMSGDVRAQNSMLLYEGR